ncbi:MAG: hypothetical protein HUU54_13305 [Ignavibacteriaceae bacterium]|nr:hypothetical protein [Ignavibacteriaceae bacterium]
MFRIIPYLSGKKYTFATFALLVSGLIFFGGCEVKEPFLPVYDADLVIPILDRKNTLMELINKDTTVLKSSTDPSSLGLLYYEDVKPLAPVLVQDKLVMNPIGVHTAVQTGTISINDPEPIQSNISVVKLVPQAQGVDSIIFPAISNKSITQNLDRIEQFSVATFESGTFRLTFTNNNGVAITINSIDFKNAYTSQVIPQLQSSVPLTINSGASGQKDFNLTGATLVDSMIIEMVVSSPGSGLSFVQLPPNAGTSVDARIINFSVEEVRAVLPPQDPVFIDSTIALDDSTFLREIVIKEGSLVFEVRNYLDVGLTAVFTFNNLKDPSNNAFTANFNLTRRGTTGDRQTVSVSSLHDYRIVSLVTGQLTNKLSYSVRLTPNATTDPRSLRKDDSMAVNIDMTDLILQSLDGRVKPTQLDFQATPIPLQLGSLSNFNASTLKFDKFLVEMFVNSSSTEQLRFAGKIRGKNRNTQATVNIPSTVLSGNPGTTQQIILSETELINFINTFATAPPDSIIFEYNAVLNPNYLTGKIEDSDSIYGTGHISTPLTMGMGNGRFVDTSEINMQEANKEQLDQLQSASITLIIENHLPMAINFNAVLLNEFGDTTMYIPPRYAPNSDTLKIRGGTVSPTTKRVTAPAVDSVTIFMKADEFLQFSRSKSIRSYIKMNTSLPAVAPVSFYTSDYIKIRGFGAVKYRVKP